MSWTTRAEGKDAKPISQIRPILDLSNYIKIIIVPIFSPMTEAIGCNLAMFIFSYNCFKKNTKSDTKSDAP